MEVIFSKQDSLQLHNILEQANRSYLKELQINEKANFNILRVLSAYRLVCPDSSNSLYNTIIYLTKIFNPQTLIQWKRAIADLQKMSSMPPKHKKQNRKTRVETSKYMRTYQNSFNKDRSKDCHFQSKSYAQIKVPRDVSFSQEVSADRSKKDISETNITGKTGKMYNYTKADSVQMQGQNHYISFQPYHQISGIYHECFHEKENVNSTNIEQSRKGKSAQQYIQAIKRDLCRTGKQQYNINKSPIDQSFIKNIDCYESPNLLTKQNEAEDSEEEQMNQRANQFLNINLKFKAYESLIANTMVLQKAKEYRMKADMQSKAALLQRSFFALIENISIQKIRKSYEFKADNHYEITSKRNIFKIFKLLFQLRNKRPPFQISKINSISYQFLLSLLLSIQGRNENDQLNLDKKMGQLIERKKIDKVCLIVKYFGNYSWISEDGVKKLIQYYRKTIMKKVFSALITEKKLNNQYLQKRNIGIIRLSFTVLKKKWQRMRKQKILLLQAEQMKNKCLISKVMKGFIQTILSKKIYSKRYEYLVTKHNCIMKSNVFDLWVDKTNQKKIHFSQIQTKVKHIIQPINIFIKRYSLRQIKSDNEQLIDKQQELSYALMLHKKKQLFKNIYQAKINKKNVIEIKQKVNILIYSRGIKKWKQNTRKAKAFENLERVLQKIYFRNCIAPIFRQTVNEFNIIENKKTETIKKSFDALKTWHQSQKIEYQNLSQILRCRLDNYQKTIFLTMLKMNHDEQQCLRKKSEIKQRLILLDKCFLHKKFTLLKEKCSDNKDFQLRTISLKEKIKLSNKKQTLKKIHLNVIQIHNFTLKKQQLRQKICLNREKEIQSQLIKHTTIGKLTKTIKKKIFYQKLQQFSEIVHKRSNLRLYIQIQRVKRFIESFTMISRKSKGKQILIKKETQLLKFLVLNRLKKSYIQSIINKKYEYMAAKFRALKISFLIFQKWKQFKFVPATKIKTHSMMNRTAKERLSTDIVE